jgi:hypothetical protein
MLNFLLLTAGTWTAISFWFVWRLATAIPSRCSPGRGSAASPDVRASVRLGNCASVIMVDRARRARTFRAVDL